MTQDIYPPPRAPGLMAVRYFTTSGTFNIADYPGAQSIRVRAQAAGGGGGSAANVPTGASGAPGGGGGEHAESLLDVGALPSSVPVTVGAGGAGGVLVDSGASGGSGGNSSFGSLVVATGGPGGNSGGSSTGHGMRSGVPGGSGGTGDALTPGGSSGSGLRAHSAASVALGGRGGDSELGSGGVDNQWNSAPGAGQGFGGGGGGACSLNGGPVAGGAGAPGIVIVEVYSTYVGDTGDFLTRSYMDSALTNYATQQYVNERTEGIGSLTYRSSFERMLASDLTIAASTWTRIAFHGDRGGNHVGADWQSTSAYNWIAPRDGWYVCSMNLEFKSGLAAATRGIVAIATGTTSTPTSPIARVDDTFAGDQWASVSGSTFLSAGTSINGYVWAGASCVIGAGTTWINVAYLG